MLIFYDRGPEEGIERINISGTNTHDLYDRPYRGQLEEKQWPLLLQIIEERDPKQIGINTGSIQWAAGGLTHNLYTQLVRALPDKYVQRLASAEPVATRWLATLTDDDLHMFAHVANVAHALLAKCYSRATILPGVTTTKDLEWAYWQYCADLGLGLSFRPFFNIVRSEAMQAEYGAAEYGADDCVIRPGDLIHSDVGIRYLRLNSDHQEWAYVLRPGECEPPAGIRNLLAQANRLQDTFMAEFNQGLTGNQILSNILTRAREQGIPDPKVYSHSLGLFLHEPGPLIGLPWEQERCAGRGDVVLNEGYCFTMELSIADEVPEWDNQRVVFSAEQDVAFTNDGCAPVDGRQTAFYLI
jgi:Xaa-Pro aminopeptidase